MKGSSLRKKYKPFGLIIVHFLCLHAVKSNVPIFCRFITLPSGMLQEASAVSNILERKLRGNSEIVNKFQLHCSFVLNFSFFISGGKKKVTPYLRQLRFYDLETVKSSFQQKVILKSRT